MEETYTIQRLAKEFGVTSRTLRFYEAKDLLHPTRKGLNRIFSHRDRARLKLILRGKRLGFSLAEIKEMLDLYTLGDGQVEQLRVTLDKLRRRIEEMELQRRDIDTILVELREGCITVEDMLAQKGVPAKEAAE